MSKRFSLTFSCFCGTFCTYFVCPRFLLLHSVSFWDFIGESDMRVGDICVLLFAIFAINLLKQEISLLDFVLNAFNFNFCS